MVQPPLRASRNLYGDPILPVAPLTERALVAIGARLLRRAPDNRRMAEKHIVVVYQGSATVVTVGAIDLAMAGVAGRQGDIL